MRQPHVPVRQLFLLLEKPFCNPGPLKNRSGSLVGACGGRGRRNSHPKFEDYRSIPRRRFAILVGQFQSIRRVLHSVNVYIPPSAMTVQTVAIVGAGTMGNGIAHVFALHGYETTLIDLDESLLDEARGTIEQNLTRQVEKDAIAPADRADALDRLSFTPDTASGVAVADLVVEAVPEERSLKAEVFGTLDEHAPDEAILASNTSSISITWIGSQTDRPDRVVGMHFFNPVPVMTLVEAVRGQRTSDATYDVVADVADDLGKHPVEVDDYPGFVSNRVLMPMINEAIFCVMEGVAEPDDIDTVMTLGMNHPMGPLTLADFIGLDVCLHILEVLHDELGDDKYRPCPLLRRKVTAGQLGRKTGEGFFEYE